MYMRFTIKVSGQKFDPKKILQQLVTNLIVDDYVEPIFYSEHEYDYGEMYLLAKQEFSHEYPDDEYQNLFIDFFDKNHNNLVLAGATDFQIMLDIYYKDQCNFEIFDKDILKKIAKYNICLPISVYKV